MSHKITILETSFADVSSSEDLSNIITFSFLSFAFVCELLLSLLKYNCMHFLCDTVCCVQIFRCIHPLTVQYFIDWGDNRESIFRVSVCNVWKH